MLPSFPVSSAPVLPGLRLPADTAASVAAVAPGASEPSSDSELAPGASPCPGPVAAAFAELLDAADTSACSDAARPCAPLTPSSETAFVGPATPCPRSSSSLHRHEAPDTQQPETPTPDALAMIMAGLIQPSAPAPTESVPALDLADGPLSQTVSDEAAASAHPIFLRTRTTETYPPSHDTTTISASLEPAPATVDDSSAPAASFPEIFSPAVFAEQPGPRSNAVAGVFHEKLKNNSQAAEQERNATREDSAGMEKAKEATVMGSASSELLFAAAATSRRGIDPTKASTAFAEPATESLSSAPMQGPAFAPHANTSSTVLSETAPASTPLPAAAVRLIERVDEVAEQVATRSSEQVKLSLDLDGDHRVEVKVAMRGGRVFADFRTDSPEMRAALTHAWDGFVRGRDGSSQRWAEPVFSSVGFAAIPAPDAPQAASPASGSFEGNLSSRQETSADQRHAPRDRTPVEDKAFSFAPSSASRAGSASPSRPGLRSDPSRLLSALA